jgi:TRAP transporter TAXI family solute receptor
MKFSAIVLAAVATAALSVPAYAQTVYAIGTNKQGSLAYSSGTAISKLMNLKGGVKMRVRPGGGSFSIVPQMNSGAIDFGINNAAESRFAYTGTGTFEKKGKMPNFRMVGVMFPLSSTLAVPNDSKIKTICDAKGARMGHKFTAQTILQLTQSALLATCGLTQEDMVNTPYSRYVPSGDDMARGKLDIAIIPPGTAASKKQHAMLRSRGGLRFLAVDDSPKAVAGMQKWYPEAYITTIKPSKRTPGVLGPIKIMTYPFFLTAGAHVPAEVVYMIIKTMAANKKELAKSHGAFNGFNAKKMYYKNTIVPYHPGAEKAYKEMGVM